MKRGLLLEGGGAKGAYQAGAIKALNERKFHFDCVGGTSIGAINAACYVSKNCDKMYKMWLRMDCEKLFGLDTSLIKRFDKKDSVGGGKKFELMENNSEHLKDLNNYIPKFFLRLYLLFQISL